VVERVKALDAESDNAVRGDGVSVSNEPNATCIVVLQRVVERESVHGVTSVGSAEGISCEFFHKIRTFLASVTQTLYARERWTD
jgi:hypothetical protein